MSNEDMSDSSFAQMIENVLIRGKVPADRLGKFLGVSPEVIAGWSHGLSLPELYTLRISIRNAISVFSQTVQHEREETKSASLSLLHQPIVLFPGGRIEIFPLDIISFDALKKREEYERLAGNAYQQPDTQVLAMIAEIRALRAKLKSALPEF